MIDPTSVPVPSDAWVAARRDHLLAELRRTRERRAHRRLVGGIGALTAAGAATAAVVLIAGGPAASTAFAGWRAAPTAAAPGQLSAAEASCPAGGPSPGGKVGPPGAVPSGPPALSDVRGPYSMLLYLDGGGGSTLCMNGASFVRVLPTPAPTAPAPPADGLVIDHLASGAVTFVEGRVGSAVTGAGLTLDDGTRVTVTVGGGHFIAWWPGGEGVATSTETTASGSKSAPADVGTDARPHPVRPARRHATMWCTCSTVLRRRLIRAVDPPTTGRGAKRGQNPYLRASAAARGWRSVTSPSLGRSSDARRKGGCGPLASDEAAFAHMEPSSTSDGARTTVAGSDGRTARPLRGRSSRPCESSDMTDLGDTAGEE